MLKITLFHKMQDFLVKCCNLTNKNISCSPIKYRNTNPLLVFPLLKLEFIRIPYFEILNKFILDN